MCIYIMEKLSEKKKKKKQSYTWFKNIRMLMMGNIRSPHTGVTLK